MTGLCLLALLAVGPREAAPAPQVPAPAQAPAPPAAAKAPAPQAATPPAEQPKGPIDLTAEVPPPGAYERSLTTGGEPAKEMDEQGRSILGQLLRTVLSLGVVVALIYLFAKVGLSRLGRLKGITGTRLKILERLPLDARNSLFLVSVDGKQFLLGGGGDKGVHIVTRLDESKGSGTQFEAVMAKREAASSPGDEGTS